MFRRCVNCVLALALLTLAACSPPTRDTPMEQSSQQPAKAKPSKASSKPSKEKDAPEPVEDGPPPIPAAATQQFEKALTLLGAGDYGPAEAEFKKLNAAYPAYSGPLANLGVLYLKTGKLNEAEKSLRAAIEISPMNAAAFNQLGIVYRNMGKFKEADTAYRQAISADPNYGLAYLNLGVLCDLYLQQPQRALESFEKYLQLVSNPDPKVNNWVRELRSRLGVKPPAAAPAEPEAAAGATP